MRERGFALLIVLWSLVLISFAVARVTSSGRTEVKLASNMREGDVAEAAADGAIYQTLFHLLAAKEQHWVASGRYRIAIGDATVQVSIDNLAGRVNPNTATPELMRELLIALGETASAATSLGDAIVMWRTPGERSGHQAADVAGTQFADIDELAAVQGMTPGLLQKLRPHLTLWWENDPDPAVADPIVLEAMQALGDRRPRAEAAERPVQIVSIVAQAVSPRGGRFVRHADAIVNAAAPRLRWRILAWDQPYEPR